MISGHNGMQKTYDLTERVLPQTINTVEPAPIEFDEYLIKTYLRAYGFTILKQITQLRTGSIKRNVNEVLQSMLEEETISQVHVEGLPPVFIQNDLLAKAFDLSNSQVRLLSPFDNSVIHRDRVKQIFNFDFRLECYTPKEKDNMGISVYLSCLEITLSEGLIVKLTEKIKNLN